MSQKLSEYNAKRRFDKTAEPPGKASKGSRGKLSFVVQKHDASRLHYDFRLEMDGVLKSWAVPKGPSLDPSAKRLAMRTEDHPYDYRNFEGVIEQGNYGAGEVIIWDRGTYHATKSRASVKSLDAGNFSFILNGTKLKGEFALVKNKKMGADAWLLVKKRDRYSSAKEVLEQGLSVASGRSLQDIKSEAGKVDLGSLKKAAYPKNVRPMLATLVAQAFDNKDWLFEIKWDGYRAIGGWDGRQAELYSRNGLDFSSRYPVIYEALHTLTRPALLDGEIVAVDPDGRANFALLQNYQRVPAGVTLLYYVFDILWYDSKELIELPLIERKQVLKSLLDHNEVIRYSDHLKADGSRFFAEVKKMGLEGIMAKRVDSHYLPGKRSKAWLKIKTYRRQEVVIGGFSDPKGSRLHLGSLLVGVYEAGKLKYAGRVGGGIPPDQLSTVRDQLERIERGSSPFSDFVKPTSDLHWVEPKLVCEVKFAQWTSEGHLRQPVFIGLRSDKNPKSVCRESEAEFNPPRAKSETKRN